MKNDIRRPTQTEVRVALPPYGSPEYWDMIGKVMDEGVTARSMGKVTLPLARRYGWRGPVDLAAFVLAFADSNAPRQWRDAFGVIDFARAVPAGQHEGLLFQGVVKSAQQHRSRTAAGVESADEAFAVYATIADTLIAQTRIAQAYVQRALAYRPATGDAQFARCVGELRSIPGVRDPDSEVCLVLPAWVASMHPANQPH